MAPGRKGHKIYISLGFTSGHHQSGLAVFFCGNILSDMELRTNLAKHAEDDGPFKSLEPYRQWESTWSSMKYFMKSKLPEHGGILLRADEFGTISRIRLSAPVEAEVGSLPLLFGKNLHSRFRISLGEKNCFLFA